MPPRSLALRKRCESEVHSLNPFVHGSYNSVAVKPRVMATRPKARRLPGAMSDGAAWRHQRPKREPSRRKVRVEEGTVSPGVLLAVA